MNTALKLGQTVYTIDVAYSDGGGCWGRQEPIKLFKVTDRKITGIFAYHKYENEGEEPSLNVRYSFSGSGYENSDKTKFWTTYPKEAAAEAYKANRETLKKLEVLI